jgi:hypothetical protein
MTSAPVCVAVRSLFDQTGAKCTQIASATSRFSTQTRLGASHPLHRSLWQNRSSARNAVEGTETAYGADPPELQSPIFLYASPPNHQSPRGGGGDVGAFHRNCQCCYEGLQTKLHIQLSTSLHVSAVITQQECNFREDSGFPCKAPTEHRIQDSICDFPLE